MQTHMPMGYQMINGEIRIDGQKSKTVVRIYEDYVTGKSMLAIAKGLKEDGIPNANDKTNWTHGAVGRILENTKYLGDDFYPPLISKEIYDKAQLKRKQTETRLGRTIQSNSMKNQGILANKVFCGECGEPYRKYTEHCGKPWEKVRWKCKKYIYDEQIEKLQQQMLTLIEDNAKQGAISEDFDEGYHQLSEQINELKTARIQAVQAQKKAENYKERVEQLDKAIITVNPQVREFDQALVKRLISSIKVHNGMKLEIQFHSGIVVKQEVDYYE